MGKYVEIGSINRFQSHTIKKTVYKIQVKRNFPSIWIKNVNILTLIILFGIVYVSK